MLRTNEYQALKLTNPRSPSNLLKVRLCHIPLTVTTSSCLTTHPAACELPNVFRYRVSYCISIFTNYLTKNKQFAVSPGFTKSLMSASMIVCQFAKSQNTFDTSSRDCNVSLVLVNRQYFSSNNVTWSHLG